jgi:hypothetical protein
MNLFATSFVTTIDPRFENALRGTLVNVRHEPFQRLLSLLCVAGMNTVALLMFVPSLVIWQAAGLGLVIALATYVLVMVGGILVFRRAIRARYGQTPVRVEVRVVEDGFELSYPRHAPRRESFDFVNNWWLDRDRIVVVLGRRPIERVAFAVDSSQLEPNARTWLLRRLATH